MPANEEEPEWGLGAERSCFGPPMGSVRTLKPSISSHSAPYCALVGGPDLLLRDLAECLDVALHDRHAARLEQCLGLVEAVDRLDVVRGPAPGSRDRRRAAASCARRRDRSRSRGSSPRRSDRNCGTSASRISRPRRSSAPSMLAIGRSPPSITPCLAAETTSPQRHRHRVAAEPVDRVGEHLGLLDADLLAAQVLRLDDRRSWWSRNGGSRSRRSTAP